MYVCMYVCMYVYIYICVCVCACVCVCMQTATPTTTTTTPTTQQNERAHRRTPSSRTIANDNCWQANKKCTLRRSTETILHHLRRTPPTHDSNTHAKYDATPSLALPPCNVDVWRGGAELFPFVEINLGAFSSNITMGVCEGDRGGQPRLSQLMIAKWCRIVSVNSYPMQ